MGDAQRVTALKEFFGVVESLGVPRRSRRQEMRRTAGRPDAEALVEVGVFGRVIFPRAGLLGGLEVVARPRLPAAQEYHDKEDGKED